MSDSIQQEYFDKFFSAVKSADVATAKATLAEEPRLIASHDPEYFGGTALNIASGRNDRPMVDMLLSHNADPNLYSDWDAGPWNAVQTALAYGHFELAEYLAENGAEIGIHEAAGLDRADHLRELIAANPDAVHLRGGDGKHPLHFARTPEIVDILLAAGADIEARDIDHHSTPLQWAISHRPDIARHLASCGAEADIFMACRVGDIELIERLVAENPGVLHERITDERFPAPDGAMNIYHFTIGTNATPLHVAASGNRSDVTKRLLELGMDANAPGGYDDGTALHMCAWHNHADCARTLLKNGADVDRNSGDIHANSPLGWAIVAGSVDVAKVFLEFGAQNRDYYLSDCQNGFNGAFAQVAHTDRENYKTLEELLKGYFG